MSTLLDFPRFDFVISLVVLWLSANLGAFIGKRRPLSEELRDDFGVVQAAILTLLGLVIGFTFSMAVSRYDLRKSYEEAEANAIGTEYVRADLLPAADASKVRDLLKNYLDQRISFYENSQRQCASAYDAATAKLQTELWSAVEVPAVRQPTPALALVVSGMNDVLNSQGYTQAAWWNRIPTGAWLLMIAVATCTNS